MADFVAQSINTSGKQKSEFRNYSSSPATVSDSGAAAGSAEDMVRWHYRLMRERQTVSFVRRMQEKYSFANGRFRERMTIREAFRKLESYVDSSDPDSDLPNMVHMMQTAEGMRRNNCPDWMVLVGLIHDMGKIMFALGGTREDGQNGDALSPQWALGGDTFVVGARLPDCTVFPEFNVLNPDMADPRYNSELGMYQPGTGLDSLLLAYGHDEYLYHMLLANGCLLPPEGLAMIRFHSCYPWHSGGAYALLSSSHDEAMRSWVLEFNKYDLYTKDNAGLGRPVEELWPFYQSLVDKYLPAERENGGLKW